MKKDISYIEFETREGEAKLWVAHRDGDVLEICGWHDGLRIAGDKTFVFVSPKQLKKLRETQTDLSAKVISGNRLRIYDV